MPPVRRSGPTGGHGHFEDVTAVITRKRRESMAGSTVIVKHEHIVNRWWQLIACIVAMMAIANLRPSGQFVSRD